MNLNITKKKVLIAGSTKGIGLALLKRFVDEGSFVFSSGRSELHVDNQSHDTFFHSRCDLQDHSQVIEMIGNIKSMVGSIDILIANVGDGRSVSDPMPSNEQFERTWLKNFKISEQIVRETLPIMTKPGGVILFISSIAGIEAIGAPTDYSVAKTAILSLSKQLARKLAPDIRVNAIAPGNVYFEGGSWDEKIKLDPEKIDKLIKATVPMQRFGTTDEIADAALFLCSDRASFITGSCLVVDGGQTVSIF